MEKIPWIFSAATAAWFGLMACRARRSWLLWGGGGAVFALVTTTIYLGLRQAGYTPSSHDAEVHFRFWSVAGAACVVGILGWFFTLSLQRWFVSLLKSGGRRDV